MEHSTARWSPGFCLAAGSALTGFATLIYFFPPMSYAFYPRCLFRSLTGFICPGCGTLRAIHQILHGNLTLAFAMNPLLFLLWPGLGLLSVEAGRMKFLHKPSDRNNFLWLVLAVMILFAVLRNF